MLQSTVLAPLFRAYKKNSLMNQRYPSKMITAIHKDGRRLLFIFSSVITVLIAIVSIVGLNDDLYERETADWRLQCLGQDLVDLYVVLPVLVTSSILLLRGKMLGFLLWPGVMLYISYAFTIYCFDVHFNELFVEYCVTLGLSVYGFAYFLYANQYILRSGTFQSKVIVKTIAIYFLIIGLVFYLNWMSDIIHATKTGGLPGKLKQTQLFTNPVHVLDVSIFLPMFLISGILLLRRKKTGLYAGVYLLTFSVLMDITILVLDMLEENNAAMRTTFIILTIISLTFLFCLIRFTKYQWKISDHEKARKLFVE